MNEKTKSTVRHVLTFAGGFLLAKGWLPADTNIDEIVSAIAAIGGLIWSIVNSHRKDKEKVA